MNSLSKGMTLIEMLVVVALIFGLIYLRTVRRETNS